MPLRTTILATLLLSLPASAQTIDYNRDIRPILSNHCYACHGPDEGQRKAKLRLDRKEDAFAETKSGVLPLVAGDPKRSELFQRIAHTSDGAMPPAKFGKPLSVQQIALIQKWIEQGAKWDGHWSYQSLKPLNVPMTKQGNPIDGFVRSRLEKEGLKASPIADRETLIRRLSFDLIGLPPTPTEIDAFVNDLSSNAYEKVVERLLRSPNFGERWATHWLDLARYADTNGYHIDNHRDMWKWREWVIQAFNENKPFDQFTIEQLAGDLLPNATIEQKIASGFNRNVMVNFEGGADPNEYMTKYIVDRVNTTATVWLGTTFGCAECHDHKYDPFTQRDFYRFYAFFNNIPERGLDGQKDNPVPFLRFESEEQKRKLQEFTKRLADLNAKIESESARVQIDESPTPVPNGPTDFIWVDDAIPTGAKGTGNEGDSSWKFVTTQFNTGKVSTVRTATGLSQQLFTDAKPGLKLGAGDKLFAYVYLDPANPPKEIMLQFNDGSWEHRAVWGENKIEWGVDNSPSRRQMGPLPALGKWTRLEVDIEAVGFKAGSQINGIAFTQFDGTVYWDTAGVKTQTPQNDGNFDSFNVWEAYEKSNTASKLPNDIKAIIKLEPTKRTAQQSSQLKKHFVQTAYTKSRGIFAPLIAERQRLMQEEATVRASSPQVMVMEEMPQPRETYMLIRGDFQKKGEKVTPGTPLSLPPLAANVKSDRLALARWLVQRDHPLTARVTVNRFWEQLFGVGIVKTSDDFGMQGEWPSHPELLDWLAHEFIESGWDMKALLRTIVMSDTYQQSAKVLPDVLARDPENRLLTRGPRFRLPAEMIRDNALAVSGLLDRRIGGPSVRPYQPAGLWEAIAFGGGFSSQTYEPSKGSDLYRRGLYVYWKRSLPHPSLTTFDAPNREVCADRRPRTNTPLQALVLMNDPIYVEASRNLAQRLIREGGKSPTEKITYAFRLLTARTPRLEELAIVTKLYEQQLVRFQQNPDGAKKLVSVGESPRPDDIDVIELAAWTTIANALMSLDETISR